MARRALDYLVGFTLSPVLWRKLPGSKSAGRVQSVALRLVCERETEIEKFKSEEYWTVDVDLMTSKQALIRSHLVNLDGKKLEKFDLNTEAKALEAKAKIEAQTFSIDNVERKKPTATRHRRLQPRPCNRKRPANCAFRQKKPCRLPKSSMKTG